MAHNFRFKKSTFSENIGNCVEPARSGPAAAIRDSKNSTGPILRIKDSAFVSFIGEIKADSLSLPS